MVVEALTIDTEDVVVVSGLILRTNKILSGNDLHTHGSASVGGSGQTDTHLTGVSSVRADALAFFTIVVEEVSSLSAFATLTEVEPASPVADGVTTVVDGHRHGGHIVFTKFFGDFHRINGELRSAFATDLLEAEVIKIIDGTTSTSNNVKSLL